MSVDATIADGIVARLQVEPAAGPFSEAFTPVRDWLPVFKVGDLATLQVTVVPLELEMEPLDREDSLHLHTIAVNVQEAVQASDRDRIDALCALQEEIRAHLKNEDMPTVDPVGKYTAIVQRPLVDPRRLRRGMFWGVIRVTYESYG